MKSALFKKVLHFILISGCMFIFSLQSFGQAKAWEGTITIPTYSFESDINPKFWAMDAGSRRSGPKIYPYTMQDDLKRKLENVTYKGLFVENEYLKVTILPELGGRIYSVLDKTTNKDMFYMNPVIKPSMIALRGAFIAGGVEWNAGPQNHTITHMSPVNGLVGQEPDGTAYIEVSNLEQSLRTTWVVRVSLHPGKAFLDENMRMYNPTDAVNPYYFWNNTAFPQLPGTRFIYPMRLGTDHGGEKFFNWPIDNGVDLSWTKNYEGGTSIFAVNAAYDFFGAYDVDLDRGMVQVANHHEHPGKKAWTWGTGEYGAISQKSLADDGTKYIEVQSGPLPTQADFGMFVPGSSIAWRECWYPVHGLGDGYEYATEKVAINTKRNEKGLEIKMIATEKYPGAVCKVMNGDKVVKQYNVDLSPVSSSTLNLGQLPQPVAIVLESKEGNELARFETPLPIPEVTRPTPPSYIRKSNDSLTVDEIYLKAQKADRNLERSSARKLYELALSKDPHHLASLRDLGILDFEACQYDKAGAAFLKALNQIPNDDGLSWYFLGLCYLKKDNVEGALHCAFKAARCLGTVALGYDLAGRVYMLKKDYPEAVKYLNNAITADKNDTRVYHHYLLAKYANGEVAEAGKLAKERINKYPSELTPRFLSAIIDNNLNDKVAEIKNFVGEKEFEIMESGYIFSNLGLYKEAIRLLETSCVNNVSPEKQNLLVLYQLGYLYSKIGNNDKAHSYIDKASKSYHDLIMASRPDEEDVLKYAISVNPKDALANYQLGNLYANFGRLDEAAEYWNKSVTNDPSMSIPWRNLGIYYWTQKNDRPKSELCFRNAIKARPFDETLYRDLAKEMVDNSKRADAITLLEHMPVKGIRRSDIVIDLAQYYLDAERYDESINRLINTPYFVNAEGSSVTWDIFNKANVGKGIALYNNKNYKSALAAFETALTFPAVLNVGKSNSNPTAKAWYWKGRALKALGKKTEAVSAWETGSELPKGRGEQNEYINICNKAKEQEAK
jgi:tetratricopeptide (TPR) repeat protein